MGCREKGDREGERERGRLALELEVSPILFSRLGQPAFWQPSSWSRAYGSEAPIGPPTAVATRLDQWRARAAGLLPGPRLLTPSSLAPSLPGLAFPWAELGAPPGRLPASPRARDCGVPHLPDPSLLSRLPSRCWLCTARRDRAGCAGISPCNCVIRVLMTLPTQRSLWRPPAARLTPSFSLFSWLLQTSKP